MKIDIDDLKDNILAHRWKERYESLSSDIKNKLDTFENSDYQLQIIKRKRIYPSVGDIFQLNPRDNIHFYGIVVNTHINNINGDDLLVIMIFHNEVKIQECIQKGIKEKDLLIPPQIVGKEYWTRGYFYNIGRFEGTMNIHNYGFYRIGKKTFVDEYENILNYEPELLGCFGVATISGIARKITQELIIRKVI